jgi:hypothetical protein
MGNKATKRIKYMTYRHIQQITMMNIVLLKTRCICVMHLLLRHHFCKHKTLSYKLEFNSMEISSCELGE